MTMAMVMMATTVTTTIATMMRVRTMITMTLMRVTMGVGGDGEQEEQLEGREHNVDNDGKPAAPPTQPASPLYWAIAVPWCTRLIEAWSSRVPVCTTNLCTGRRDDNSTTRYPVPLSNPIQITLLDATAAHEMKLLAAGTLLAQIAEMCWTLELYHDISRGSRVLNRASAS